MTTIFVTGTGTDVGKTFVLAAIIRCLRETGRDVSAIKPLVSGFDPPSATASDPGVLLEALGRPLTAGELDRISPWRFAAPLAPDLAAAREGRTVDFNALVDFCRTTAATTKGILLIEGVGGIMVPIDRSHTVLDWMKLMRAPVIVVAGSYLGTVSHTLTALHVLAGRNIDIKAVVISESQTTGASLEETTATIARFAGAVEIVSVPRLAGNAHHHPAFKQIIDML